MTKNCKCVNCECKSCGKQDAPWGDPWSCDSDCKCCDK